MANNQEVEILAYCGLYMKSTLAYFGTLTNLATWAFCLAIGLAILSALVEIYARIRAVNQAAAANDALAADAVAPSSDLIKALTALIDSLAKAPVWFFLFVAGMALVWLSTIDLPRICMPAPPAASGATAGPAPGGPAAKPPPPAPPPAAKK
ncbi:MULTISPECIES: hypothetical protein [unclassified Sphingopyxis]|uniref:hypothetical protein n=1 Tax=unclassified Sphingopyxis TaxID=2614943 RepID=UPI000AB17BA8|nr:MULTISPECIES: hypothetical protein [unclassified Sphingopyxis]